MKALPVRFPCEEVVRIAVERVAGKFVREPPGGAEYPQAGNRLAPLSEAERFVEDM